MGQKKLRPFAEILILVNSLTDDQKADLLDVLRGKPTRAKSEKPRAARVSKEPKAKMCATCGNDEVFLDHFQPSPNYHPFAADMKKKGG